MASCKECIHFDRCKGLYKFDRLQKAVSKGCSYFRDRSRFVELPCKVGDTVYAYWDMDNPCSNYLHVIEDFIIDLVILVDRKNSVIGFIAGRRQNRISHPRRSRAGIEGA